MESGKDSLLDLERHRRRLEESINELQQALQHWRTWDAEYEALKEELQSYSEPSPNELGRIRDEFEGELVNRKEVDGIFGPKGQRSRDQIINILDRRIDYVTQSVQSLQKQLETAENKHAAASIVSQPDAHDDEGRPITEIVEELDEDDNVVSYKLSQPGESLPHIREALQKAGIKDLPSEENSHSDSKPVELPSLRKEPSTVKSDTRSEPLVGDGGKTKKAARKGVLFAEDVKPAAPAETEKSLAAKRVENIMKEAEDQEEIIKQQAVIPVDEDPEDADLRREMLSYSMGQIGAVVAELDIEEGDSDEWDYGDDHFDEDDDDDDDEVGEDKYGRSTGRVVTDDYRQRMLELEQKLGIKSRFTSAKQQEGDDSDSDDHRMGRIVVNKDTTPKPLPSQPAINKTVAESSKETKDTSGVRKKGVRFADSLDISSDTTPPAPVLRERKDVVEPLSDIVERTSSGNPTDAKPSRKPSRFKKARNETASADGIPKGPFDVSPAFLNNYHSMAPSAPSATSSASITTPSGPEGTAIADKLVERETVARPTNDEEDEDFIDQGELVDRHQRLRRKFIQQQGGFLKEDESAFQPVDEAEGGAGRPSRFKAARLSKQ